MFRAAQETSTGISRREKDFEPKYTQERNPVYSGKPNDSLYNFIRLLYLIF
jgi:hypothetical protein